MKGNEHGCRGRVQLITLSHDYEFSLPISGVTIDSSIIASKATEILNGLGYLAMPDDLESPPMSFEERCDELFVRVDRLFNDSNYLLKEFH